jgi:hypothetical protein
VGHPPPPKNTGFHQKAVRKRTRLKSANHLPSIL